MAERLLLQITKNCLFFIEERVVFLRLVTARLRVGFLFFLDVRLVFLICVRRAMWIAAYVYVRDPSSWCPDFELCSARVLR